MPNHTVSGNVDTMMRAADNAAIRSAIGVGTTDAPTFLAITLNDTPLVRDAAGVLAQRNGTNAQMFRVYNTYTDASNYERVQVGYSSGAAAFQILSDALGTGVARQLHIGTNTSASLILMTGNTAKWYINSAGHFLAATDALYDIGASGANRPKDIYASGMISSSGYIRSSAGYRFLANGSYFVESGNGVLNLTDSTLAGFGRLQLGGTADTHPAIARDGAGIKFTGAAAGSTSWIKVPAVAVASLPAAATAGVGARAFVSDALTPVFGSAVTGGGAVNVPVYSTGSAWNVG